ncbi:hypothetical protein JCM11251_004745 [Rhodosporidiobolus azoricus]
MMPSTPPLPLETLEEIASYLRAPDLAALCRANRRFLDVARPLLWREIPIDVVLDEKVNEEGWEEERSPFFRYTQASLGLLQSLQSGKHLRPLPRRAIFSTVVGNATAIFTTADCALYSIARLCPNVDALTAAEGQEANFNAIVREGIFEGRGGIKAYDPGLLSLDSWKAIRQEQTTIRDLAFTSGRGPRSADIEHFMTAFTSLRLRSLSIRHFAPFDDENRRIARKVFSRLTDSSSATLTSLHTLFDYAIISSLHTFTTLQHVSFLFLNTPHLPEQLEDLPSVVASAPTLRSLRIRVEHDAKLSAKAILALCNPKHDGLAQKLPPTLGLLEIPAGPLPSSLLIFVTAIQAPRLHTLIFSRVKETLLISSEEPPFSRFGELEALCREKGINLVSDRGETL